MALKEEEEVGASSGRSEIASIVPEDDQAPFWAVVLAFATLYVVWGSTYLGIKVAIETMPPFLMATARFLLAGMVLYGLARARGATKPTGSQWLHSTIVGGLMIAGGNGVVTFAETWIDSSMAALIIASGPFFMTLFGWWGGVQERPTWRVWLSVIGGFLGVGLLIGTGNGSVTNSFLGYGLVVVAVMLWTFAAVYSKRNPLKINVWLQSGMQMFCGGLVCLAAGAALGEFGDVDVAAISARSWWAFGYLIAMGSLAGFTSYVYLLKHRSPSAVASHAYVNPVVAVGLGWLILGETLTLGGILGSGVILVCVFELLRRK
ncbi:MAG: EamA family transporter [Verrucomicrobiota bacterium]